MAGTERLEHGVHIVGDRCSAVVVRRRAQLDGALVGRIERVVAVLEGFAVQGRRPAGAAIVDEEQIPVIHDRREQVEVRVLRAGRREAGPALDRDDRAF